MPGSAEALPVRAGAGERLELAGARRERTFTAGHTCAALVVLGACFAALNGDLPIVRNAMLYAQIAASLLAHGMRLWTVCSDPALVFNKPCGFAALAAPLVAGLGTNVGLVAASVLGGALLVLSTWAFLGRFHSRFGLDGRALPLALAVSCFNPLVIYQFWSGYSDACFSAGFLYSFVVLDRLIREQTRSRWALLYFCTFVFCTLMKHGTIVMLPLHGLYLLWHKRELRDTWRDHRMQLWALSAAVLCSAGFLILGRLGANPMLNLEANRGQLSGDINYAMNVKLIVVFLLVTLGAFVALLPVIRITRADAAFISVAVLNAHLLSVYRGSSYNTRYYIPLLPILALYLVRAWGELRFRRARRVLVVAFFALNGMAIVLFNQRSLYRWMTAQLPGIGFGATTYFDCLRMGDHLEASELIDGVNQLPEHARLFHVSSYYGEGGFGVYERAGFFRPDIRVSYREHLTANDIRELEAAGAYVMYPPPFAPEPIAGMEPLGPRLFQIRGPY